MQWVDGSFGVCLICFPYLPGGRNAWEVSLYINAHLHTCNHMSIYYIYNYIHIDVDNG